MTSTTQINKMTLSKKVLVTIGMFILIKFTL